MADHYLSLPGGVTACFKTACDIKSEEQIRLHLGAYVPGISFLDKKPDHVDFTLEHALSDTPRLEQNGGHITLHAPRDKKFPDDLYHLLYGIERKALLERGLYPVHAACVGKDGEYMLLIGHSGAGKTTLASKLVEKQGFKLFSGNKTVVRFDADGLTAVAGTRTMTALSPAFNRYAFEMKPEEYAPEKEEKIKAVVIVRVNDGVEECQVLKPGSALHTLYPYFLDAVNGDIIVTGGNIFNGDIPAQTKENLAKDLGKAVQTLPVRKISGSMPFMEAKAAVS